MSQYIGEVRVFPKNHKPKGFLECDGQEIYINEWPRLYMVIGSRFGGDGKIKYKLPKMEYDENPSFSYFIACEGEKA